MIQKIVELIQNNRLPEARSLCEQLSRSNKKNPQIWMLLADIHERTMAFDKAETCYRKSINLKVDHVPAHTRLAMLYHKQGKFAKAERHYRQSLKFNNNQASVHFNLGAVLQELSRPDNAVDEYRQAIKIKPDYAKAYANLGYILRNQGNIGEALSSYQKALQFAPNSAEIHYNLGLALLEAGQADNSEKHQREALSIMPDYADAWAGLGAAQFHKGNTENSADNYRQALNLQPDNVKFLCSYAEILSSLGNHEQSIEHLEQAQNIAPGNADIYITKGYIHLAIGQPDEALECYNQAYKINPQHKKAMCLAASAFERKGDIKQAHHYLAPLLQDNPPMLEAVLCFASISKSLDLLDSAIEHMEQYFQNIKNLHDIDRRRLYFALGKAYDSRNGYDKAFKNYQKANKLKRAEFDIKSIQSYFDALIQTFSSGFSSRFKAATNCSDRPIFIVGMPRSGTSLVEQIIASHSLVSGAGELPDINKLALSMHLTNGINGKYPECIENSNQQQINQMANTYLERLSDIDNNARHVTDKMPSNFVHLGLIQLMFPRAHIIHCTRDPLDNCLSCYFQDFATDHPWIYDLKDIGNYYLEYRRLMQHWRDVLDIQILDVNYEELVANQQLVSRRIIEFCNLEWEDSCMQFHTNKRLIWTASYEQVRKPMYQDSVKRWKNYETNITELIELLQDV